MLVLHMSIQMTFVAEDRRTNSTRETNTIVIFLMSFQITFTCKRGWTLIAFKHVV